MREKRMEKKPLERWMHCRIWPVFWLRSASSLDVKEPTRGLYSRDVVERSTFLWVGNSFRKLEILKASL